MSRADVLPVAWAAAQSATLVAQGTFAGLDQLEQRNICRCAQQTVAASLACPRFGEARLEQQVEDLGRISEREVHFGRDFANLLQSAALIGTSERQGRPYDIVAAFSQSQVHVGKNTLTLHIKSNTVRTARQSM